MQYEQLPDMVTPTSNCHEDVDNFPTMLHLAAAPRKCMAGVRLADIKLYVV